MKTLKYVFYILIALLLVYLITCFIAPKRVDVTRTTTMAAPPVLIHQQISNLPNWDSWSPWNKMDTTMKVSYADQKIGVGASYTWESKQGGGKLEIIESSDKAMKTKLNFDGWDGNSFGQWNLEPEEDGNTKVSWGMSSDTDAPFIFRGLMMLQGMKSTMENSFDTGLANIKEIVEGQMEAIKATTVSKQNTRDRHFLTYREKTPLANLQQFFGERLSGAVGVLTQNQIEMAGMPAAIYYEWDPHSGSTDVAAAIPIASPVASIEEYSGVSLPASEALVVDYFGSYNNLSIPHTAIDNYINANGISQEGPVLEEYLNDPTTVSEDSIHTRISYYLN